MCVRKLFAVLLIGLAGGITKGIAASAYPPPTEYILVDARLMRYYLGFSEVQLKKIDGVPDRVAGMFDMQIDTRLLSLASKPNRNIQIQDAFFAQISFGRLSSEPLSYYNYPEGRWAFQLRSGYSLLVMYQNDIAGVGLGYKAQITSSMLGGTNFHKDIVTGTGALQIGANFRPGFSDEFRLFVVAWRNFNESNRDAGITLNIPLAPRRRVWLYASYCVQNSEFIEPASFDVNAFATGKLVQRSLGLRFGALY